MIIKILIPSDPILFKKELLITKRAKRTLTYKDGSERVEIWNASRFTASSDLMHNISSQLDHRKDRAHIIKVVYEIEEINHDNEYIHFDGEYSKEIYIHYVKGWSSFRPLDEHISEYIIKNDVITIYRNNGFALGKSNVKRISSKDMKELLSILYEATRKGAFGKSKTQVRTIHGPICSYDYDYHNQSGRDCGALFSDDILNDRYHDLINKIIK